MLGHEGEQADFYLQGGNSIGRRTREIVTGGDEGREIGGGGRSSEFEEVAEEVERGFHAVGRGNERIVDLFGGGFSAVPGGGGGGDFGPAADDFGVGAGHEFEVK